MSFVLRRIFAIFHFVMVHIRQWFGDLLPLSLLPTPEKLPPGTSVSRRSGQRIGRKCAVVESANDAIFPNQAPPGNQEGLPGLSRGVTGQAWPVCPVPLALACLCGLSPVNSQLSLATCQFAIVYSQ